MLIGPDTIARLTLRAVLGGPDTGTGTTPDRHRLARRPDGGLVVVGPSGVQWLRADLTEERFVAAPASAVAVLDDGTVVTGRPGGPMLRWTADGRSSRVVGRGAVDMVTSADGRWLAVVDDDGAVTVRSDGAPPMVLSPVEDHPHPLVALSADGSLLATSSGLGVVVRTVPGGAPVDVVGGFGPPTGLAFESHGRGLLLATDRSRWPELAGGVERWDIGDPASVPVRPPPHPDDPPGQRDDVSTLRWEVGAGIGNARLPHDARTVSCVATSPDGRLVAVGTEQGTHLLSLAAGESVAVLAGAGNQAPVRQLSFAPDGATLAVVHPRAVQVWSVAGPTLLAGCGYGAESWSAACFSPDGRLLAVGDGDDLVVLWDTERPRPLRALEGASWRKRSIDQVVFSAGGLLVAALDTERVRVWWTATGALATEPIGTGEKLFAMAAHPHRPLLAVAAQGGTRIHDLLAGTVVAELPEPRAGPGDPLSFSPDGALLAGAVDDTTVGLWSTADWTRRTTLSTWSNRIVFTPDSRLVATVHPDRHVRLWRVDGRPGPPLAVAAVPAHWRYSAPELAVSADGGLLLAGQQRAWRLADGAPVDPPPCGPVVAFSPDGRQVLAAEGYRLALWGLDDHQ